MQSERNQTREHVRPECCNRFEIPYDVEEKLYKVDGEIQSNKAQYEAK